VAAGVGLDDGFPLPPPLPTGAAVVVVVVGAGAGAAAGLLVATVGLRVGCTVVGRRVGPVGALVARGDGPAVG
jgi:hypothetical protein